MFNVDVINLLEN